MTYESVYPPAHSDVYVKATTKAWTDRWPYFATDPTKSLVGEEANNSWASNSRINQRFHIDYGTAKVIKRLYYENYHYYGSYTNIGAHNFAIYGSNEASAFADLDFTHDTNWTLIADSLQFDQHVSSNIADPKYIEISNSVGYRYYCLKISDNWGSTNPNQVGLRRIELQVGTSLLANPRLFTFHG